MAATLLHCPILHIKDSVRARRIIEFMRCKHYRPPLFLHTKHGIIKGLRRINIQICCRFIKNKQRRFRGIRPCNRNFLPLTAGKPIAILPGWRVIPFFHPADKSIAVRLSAGRFDLFVRSVWPGMTDIVTDRIVKQEYILIHH